MVTSGRINISLRHQIAPFASLLFLVAYLVFHPSGAAGLVLSGAAVLTSLLSLNRVTLTSYGLIGAPALAGVLFQLWNFPLPGSILPLSVSIAYVLTRVRRLPSGAGRPIAWIVSVIAVIAMSYLWGPQSPYSSDKLLWFILNFGIWLAFATLIFGDRDVQFGRLGQILVSSCAMLLAAAIYSEPTIAPDNFLQVAALRTAAYGAGFVDADLASHTIGSLGCWGVAAAITRLMSPVKTFGEKYATVMICIGGMILLNAVGARHLLIGPMVALAASLVVRDANNLRLRLAMFATVCVGFIIIIILGLKAGNNAFLDQVFNANATLDERVNRSVNWQAALEIIRAFPFFGAGLGGYFVHGLSAPGDGYYAHNIILEILSETGLFGFTVIVVPVALYYISGNIRVLHSRSPGGYHYLPLYVVLFLTAMVSKDLRYSSSLLALTAVSWAFMNRGRDISPPYSFTRGSHDKGG